MSSILRSRPAPGPAARLQLTRRLLAIPAWFTHWNWLLLPLLAIPAVWPFYSYGLPRSADGALHLLRLVLLDHHVRAGTFYPRWVPELVLGYGYPVFNFYGPATYYLAEALHLLGAGYYEALMGTFALLVLLGGAGMWLMAFDLFENLEEPGRRWAAVVAATAYMYAPYLLTNVYLRGAIAEVGAQALLPWIFWTFRRLARSTRPHRWLVPAALSLAALAITHNITLLFVPPVLLAYMALLWWRSERSATRLAWLTGAGVAAMGISAFFWLPLVVERAYLSPAAYDVSARYLPENVWTWRNFLDPGLSFEYTLSIPFQLGLIQLLLAAAGFIAARRKGAEWLFFLTIALAGSLGIGAVTLPVWMGSKTLLIAQFPWRLLTLVSVPLAIFAGGLVVPLQRTRRLALGAPALLAVIIFANYPRIGWIEILPTDNAALGLASIAQFEAETGGLGTSSSREFAPRWVRDVAPAQAEGERVTTVPAEINLHAANAYTLDATVAVPSASTLRLSTFYFPGWTARAGTEPTLPVHPTTAAGLLTVDLPPGTHHLRVAWEGTPLQRGATVVSLATLAILSALLLLRWRAYFFATMTGTLFAAGLVVALWPAPSPQPVQAPEQPFSTEAIQLLGYRTERPSPSTLHVHAYWYTRAALPDQRVHWRLTGPTGTLVSEVVARPYFNTSSTANWPAATIVDDVYKVALPPGLAPGEYRLWLQWHEEADEVGQMETFSLVGTVRTDVEVPVQPVPGRKTELNFGDQIALEGFDLAINGKPVTGEHKYPLARPGDLVEYTLYWRARRPVDENYHGFVHLLGSGGRRLVGQDQLPGSLFRAPRLWDSFYFQPDTYRLRIPDSAESGLYHPQVGLYRFDTLERLAVHDGAGAALGDSVTLPPVKVYRAAHLAPPQHAVAGRFGEHATMLGYDLDQPTTLTAGSTFTLTLYYKAESPPETDYTRFVHLYDPVLGMAAQHDGRPQEGANPMPAWVAGEVVRDQVSVTLGNDVTPGVYTLRLGFYDAGAGGTRLPAFDQTGASLPDNQIILTEIKVGG